MKEKFNLSGIIVSTNSFDVANVLVDIYYLGLKDQKLLAQAKTDSNGRYKLLFEWAGKADFLIKATKAGKDIASPVIKYDAKQKEQINFTIDEKNLNRTPEYTRLLTSTEVNLDGAKLVSLNDDQLQILAGKTKTNKENITKFAAAHKLAEKHKLPAEFLYGLLRNNRSEKLINIASQPSRVIENDINRAVKKNIIAASYKKRSNELVQKLRQAASKELLKSSGQGSLKSLLQLTTLDSSQQETFANVLLKSKSESVDFWSELKKAPGFNKKGLTEELESLATIHQLSGNNLTLTKALKPKAKNMRSVAAFSEWDTKDWKGFITKNKIEIPKSIEGKTNSERISNYAANLTNNFEIAYPSQRSISKISAATKNKDLKSFFNIAQDFDLGKTNIDSYLKGNVSKLTGKVKNIESLGKELKSWQRVYRITPETGKFEGMEALVKAGLDASVKITKGKTKNGFIKQFSDVLGGEAAAANVYNKAANTTASAISLLGKLSSVYTTLPGVITIPEISVSTETEAIDIPDLETLFGSQSYCECEHCRSVLSPAAYLVDLLEFLRNSDANDNGDTPKDVLFERRPDLGSIELSCENTNTALPYLDLVIEALENGVLLHNSKTVDYTFQTTGTTQELQAQPEHINSEAYTIVGEAVYPFNLPFHMWNAEGEIYLEKLGIPRFKLMETTQFIGNSNEPTDLEVACTHLKLSENEKDIISGKLRIGSKLYTVKKFWGESASTWVDDLSNVEYFLDKTGLDYDELLKLLQVKFINPDDDIVIDYSGSSSACDISGAVIKYSDGSSLDSNFFQRLHRFLRLWKKLNWDILDLDKCIQTIGESNFTNIFFKYLSNIKWLKDELKIKSLPDLLSWWADLNTSIDENDETSRSFYETLFLNKAVSNPVEEVFELNEEKTRLEIEDSGTTVNISDYSSYIAAALNVNSADLDLLFSELSDTTLTLGNLSELYRYASAAKILDLDIDEFLILKEILPYNPFDKSDIGGAKDFAEAVSEIKGSGLSVKELDYLFRHKYDLTENIAPSEDSIGDVLSQIQEGVLKIQSENNFDSDPTGETTRTKLAQLLDETSYQQLTDIINEQSTLSTTEQETLIEEKLTFLDPTEAKSNLMSIDTTVSQDERIQNRYAYLFEPLIDYMIEIQSRDFIAQTLSSEFDIDFDTSKLLLTELATSPADSSKFAIDELLDSTFINYEYAEDETINYELFTNQYNMYKLLEKAATIISKLSYSNEDLIWIYENAGEIGWLDLNKLPISETEDAAGIFLSWRLIYRFSKFNEKYTTEDTSTVTLLDMALNKTDYDPETTVEIFKETVLELTSWETADLDFLTETSAYNLTLDKFTDGSALYQLDKCIALTTTLGVSAESFWSWLETDLDESEAATIKQAAKAKYSTDQWLSVAPPLRDKLRSQQRDALTAYLIAEEDFEDKNDLLEHYLIDVEMEPCMLTSRIKQACSSVQMFIQRSFMGLEADVTFDEDQLELWEWMKNYRVWEANRKVFLYPENWLEPDLRTDQSEFFEEFRNELLQNEINEDNVETAFIHYLEKLDDVSRMQVVGTYHQIEESDDEEETIDIFHVIARTRSYPHIYYYRRLEDESWSPWEKVDADVEGNHVLFSVVNRRLFIFWPVFTEISKDASSIIKEYELEDFVENIATSNGYSNTDDYLSEELSDPFLRYEIKLCYSEYKTDKWLPKKITKEAIHSEEAMSMLLYLNKNYELSQEDFCFYTEISGDVAKVTAYHHVVFTGEDGTRYDNFRYTLGTFELDVLTKEFVANEEDDRYNWLLLLFGVPIPLDNKSIKAPDDSDQKYNMFEENSGTHDLVLYTKNEDDEYESKVVLGLTPGTFNIPIPVQYDEFTSQDSFFYQDDDRGFFVTPKETTTKITSISNSGKNNGILFNSSYFITSLKYKFDAFYHPYSTELIKTLNKDGLDGFMNRSTQIQQVDFFDSIYDPQAVTLPYPLKNIDFEYGKSYSIYNWELFFHAPMLIASHLSQNQQFDEAQKWYHYIFNPTDRTEDENPTPQRYWQLKPFFEEVTLSSIYDMMYALSYTGTDEETLALKEQVEAQIEAWKDDPFEPHTIAQLRIVAHMKSVVMKYIDNLIAWGDSLFRQDTIESINEATQLYILALKILGDKPEDIPQEETDSKTYNELLDYGIDSFSNALVELETYTSSSSSSSSSSVSSLLLFNLYFCVPHNEKLLKYWETVEDRLFKIRNCMNLEGVIRSLALFEPPIDPGMLVKARAAGVDLGSILSDLFTPLPSYRFRFYIQKATQFCGDVQNMGNALLTALEKKDGEALALLKANHELKLLQANRELKKLQLKEAQETLESLKRTKETAESRYNYYKLIEKTIELEDSNIELLNEADKFRKKAGNTDILAASLNAIPNFSYGFEGLPSWSISFGGSNLGSIASAFASSYRNDSASSSHHATIASVNAGYERRWSDWKLQETLAEKEMKQIDKQIAAAEIRVSIMEQELENHELQQEQSKEAYEFLSNKFTNKELYQWMSTQLSTLYFQSYQLAYDCAKRAQKAFQYELGSDQTFIQYGYWDSLKKGLLAGEKLLYDLKRMEMAFYEQNKRGYEITKNISLAMNDPMALVMLRQTGECYIELPEAIFDLDYAGHYMRRVKSLSLTIPCIAGPYTGLSCTLTLLENRYRKDPDASSSYEETENDSRFVYNQASIQSIATSTGRNDSGMFQLNFDDDRYLPFEGAGAISRWRIQLPSSLRAFDYASISDVILQLNYTAKDGGESLKSTVTSEMENAIVSMALGSGNTGLTRMFSSKQEYSGDWYRFLNPPTDQDGQSITLEIDQGKFPYLFKDYTLKVNKTELFFVVDKSYLTGSTTMRVNLTLPSGTTNEISLSEHANIEGLLYGSIESISEEPGEWQIELSEDQIPEDIETETDDHSRLDKEAVLDLFLICHYTIT